MRGRGGGMCGGFVSCVLMLHAQCTHSFISSLCALSSGIIPHFLCLQTSVTSTVNLVWIALIAAAITPIVFVERRRHSTPCHSHSHSSGLHSILLFTLPSFPSTAARDLAGIQRISATITTSNSHRASECASFQRVGAEDRGFRTRSSE